METVLVLDTSAFVMGFNPLAVNLPIFSTPMVADELTVEGPARMRFVASLETGRLMVMTPKDSSVRTVVEEAMKVGDIGSLSQADIQVLALALDLKLQGKSPVVVSDDYSIQNVADVLGIGYRPLATFGISSRFDWVYYCPACFRKYIGTEEKTCRVCGTVLRRRVLRKHDPSRRVLS